MEAASDLPSLAKSLLALAARWTPLALGALLGDALELAALQGREAVFLDAEDSIAFAEADVFNQPFKEQIAYFLQKRVKPTKVWTDAMRGVHDRAFVIAGATDTAMLSDFQTAIAKAMTDGTGLDAFRKDFDRLVEQYGWKYKGEHGWRTRIIFETNIRTSYMAGRLKQMRDPDVIKSRPYWEYRHGEIRQPKTPRPLHLKWHGKILRHDDPWWETHFPPNDWLCSCGVRTLSEVDLKRRGKTGPDPSPDPLMTPIIDPISGKLTERPQGVGYGWDYQPGNLWDQGLVPSALLDAGNLTLDNPRMAVAIDTPEPIEDLVAAARPFKAKVKPEGLPPDDYVQAFLQPFGASAGQAVLFEDKAGAKLPISDQLFRGRNEDVRVAKKELEALMPLLAETLMDPDEIWIGVIRQSDPLNDLAEELIVDRRYIRADPKTGLLIVLEIGERLWDAITAYFTKATKPDLAEIDRLRGGKLVFKRTRK